MRRKVYAIIMLTIVVGILMSSCQTYNFLETEKRVEEDSAGKQTISYYVEGERVDFDTYLRTLEVASLERSAYESILMGIGALDTALMLFLISISGLKIK